MFSVPCSAQIGAHTGHQTKWGLSLCDSAKQLTINELAHVVLLEDKGSVPQLMNLKLQFRKKNPKT